MPECLFCSMPRDNFVCENALAYAVYDKYPVNPGHVLVIPKRHFPGFFDATDEEIVACYSLIKDVRKLLDEKFRPDGYNIGVNHGACAGQTIWHLHFHVIPRYTGDVDRPMGGVRRVKPNIASSPAER
ncbi:HIT family protein [Desulforudis sp. 1088]|uniref:HIT family protein n=1 Tax=unclassified Candidatus Desulforudis TaxID=2635950 RepID=UPI003CE4D0FD